MNECDNKIREKIETDWHVNKTDFKQSRGSSEIELRSGSFELIFLVVTCQVPGCGDETMRSLHVATC